MDCPPRIALTLGLLGLLPHASARAADPVIIVTPPDGAVVAPLFAVKVSFGDVEYCDTDGCTDQPADTVELNADSMSIDQCYPCNTGEADFDVMLTPGEHELQAIAYAGFAPAWSEPVKVTVEDPTTGGESDPSGTSSGDDTQAGTSDAGSITSPGTTGTTSEAGASSDADPVKDDGCACDLDQRPGRGLTWSGLACLALWRRRRSC